MTGSLPSILEKIIATKREEVARISPPSELPRPEAPGEVLSFRQSILRQRALGRLAFICECKKGSPSAGVIEPDYDPAATARIYDQGGAAAISVLTDEQYFFGSLNDLVSVRRAVTTPLLRKDFFIDPLQIEQAAACGAQAFLLIAAVLDEATLRSLREYGQSLGLEALVEVHNEVELERALQSGATIIGVNNRNLHDFSEDLATTARLRAHFNRLVKPSEQERFIFVSESAIRSADDIRTVAPHSDAVLIGTSLMKGNTPELLGELIKAGQKA